MVIITDNPSEIFFSDGLIHLHTLKNSLFSAKMAKQGKHTMSLPTPVDPQNDTPAERLDRR